MIKITMHVEGMRCPHCEAHMNSALKEALKVKKVISSHVDKKTEITAWEKIPESQIIEAVKETGYIVSDINYEEKKGFPLFKK